MAFPAAFMDSLMSPGEIKREAKYLKATLIKLGQTTHCSDNRILLAARCGGLLDQNLLNLVLDSDHPALCVLDILRKTLHRGLSDKGCNDPVTAIQVQAIINAIGDLGGSIGGAERIQNTPCERHPLEL